MDTQEDSSTGRFPNDSGSVTYQNKEWLLKRLCEEDGNHSLSLRQLSTQRQS